MTREVTAEPGRRSVPSEQVGGLENVELLRGFGATALCALVGTYLVIRIYRTSSVVDLPNDRSSHTAPTIRGAGLALAVAMFVGLEVAGGGRFEGIDLLIVGTALCALVGLTEDLVGLRALVRLGLQIVTASFVLPTLFADTVLTAGERTALSALALVVLVGFVNAFNFMDGINGISGWHAVVMGGAYALLGLQQDEPAILVAGVVAAGGGIGFLPWNFPRARCFLGDAGSYALGAWFAITFLLCVRAGVALDVAAAPLALYVADAGVTLIRRVRRGERWYESHREHVYQRLTEAGQWTHARASLFVAGMSGIVGVLGLAADGAAMGVRVLLWLAAATTLAAYLLSGGLVRRLRARTSPTAPPALGGELAEERIGDPLGGTAVPEDWPSWDDPRVDRRTSGLTDRRRRRPDHHVGAFGDGDRAFGAVAQGDARDAE